MYEFTIENRDSLFLNFNKCNDRMYVIIENVESNKIVCIIREKLY